MNNWLEMWSPFPNLSSLRQNIAPATAWFSPTIEYNFAGNRQIESDIIANTASYGRQLGRLTAAVLELGGGSDGPAMRGLRELAERIERRKEENKAALDEDLTRKLDRLREADPAALRRLLRRYAD